MKRWPSDLQKLIQHFGRLPGIGPKMAERLVLYLIKRPPTDLSSFAELLTKIQKHTHQCEVCNTLTEKKLCDICNDSRRDSSLLCVVADPVAALNIENSDQFKGYYFILGGLLNPIEGITPDKLYFKKLMQKIKKSPTLKEITLAFNANVEGEATMLYIKKLLTPFPSIKLTKLARGLPMGSDLAYADEVTLSAAINERQRL